MGYKDLLVTPIFLIIVYFLAYLIRPKVSDKLTRKYFIPALTLKIIGAIAVGVIYQFYYKGGDTFNYFTHGSQHIWEAFLESPILGLKILMSGGEYSPENYKYASRILFFQNESSFFIIRVSAILGLFTFHTYSSIAILFAILSFVGLWAMYYGLNKLFPTQHKSFAIAIFFIPSVFFWGSGLLKDTITLGALGLATYCIIMLFFIKKNYFLNILLLFGAFYLIYNVKIYILICFIPAVITWLFLNFKNKFKSPIMRAGILPLLIFIAILFSYFAVNQVVEDNKRYSLDNLATTAAITAYDIRFWTGRDAGSGYTLGELDGTLESMLRLTPSAINVTLFRPYLWEANNPLMIISALESLFFLLFSIYIIVVAGVFKTFKIIFQEPIVAFCLIFAISFAFAVGVSTFNFGTLVRYKIPMVPYYLLGLIIIKHYLDTSKNKSKKIIRESFINLEDIKIQNA